MAEQDELTRLSVNMNPETAAALKAISARAGTSHTESVRRAISILDFLMTERAEGNSIVIHEPRGSLRELVFF